MFKVPYPVEQRNVVKQVRVGKGYDSKTFAKLWTLVLRESGGEKKERKAFSVEEALQKQKQNHHR